MYGVVFFIVGKLLLGFILRVVIDYIFSLNTCIQMRHTSFKRECQRRKKKKVRAIEVRE